MRANDLLVVSRDYEGNVMLEGKSNVQLCLLGASIRNANPREAFSNVHSIHVAEGEMGMLAIVARIPRDKRTSEDYNFFLNVGGPMMGEPPFVDLNNQWMPKGPDRLGKIVYGNIEIRVGDTIYSSKAQFIVGDPLHADANLICRYMDGKISQKEFLAEVNTPTPEQVAKDEFARLQKAYDSVCQELMDTITKKHQLEKNLITLESIGEELVAIVEKRWYKSQATKLVLKQFKNFVNITQ